LALRDIPVGTPILYLCDNPALLKTVKRLVAESARRQHFVGSNERVSKKNNNRISNASGQSEYTQDAEANEEANLATCKQTR